MRGLALLLAPALRPEAKGSAFGAPQAMSVAIVGGGPAGLRAAEVAAGLGARVTVYEGQPSVGRKFLVAGKGGLNLTHEEPRREFVARYQGAEQPSGFWEKLLERHGPEEMREWAAGLGIPTFVAGTGRVYPRELKAAGLLRAWVKRLRNLDVTFRVREKLVQLEPTRGGGWRLEFAGGEGWSEAKAVVLAMGGGSWPQTGSDARWTPVLERLGVKVTPLAPANCGWSAPWPADGLEAVEGQPLKNIEASAGEAGRVVAVRGELLVTKYGLEGGAIYQLGPQLRAMHELRLLVDFKPQSSREQLRRRWPAAAGGATWTEAAKRWRLSAAAIWILEHFGGGAEGNGVGELAQQVKACAIPLIKPRPLAEAISSAGGVAWAELDEGLMLHRAHGVFVAGEMVNWEAPTGGYLLQGAFSMGTLAGRGAAAWVQKGRGG